MTEWVFSRFPLYVRKDVLHDHLKIAFHPFGPVNNLHVPREKGIYIKLGKTADALFQKGAAPSGKIRPSHILAEYDIP